MLDRRGDAAPIIPRLARGVDASAQQEAARLIAGPIVSETPGEDRQVSEATFLDVHELPLGAIRQK